MDNYVRNLNEETNLTKLSGYAVEFCHAMTLMCDQSV